MSHWRLHPTLPIFAVKGDAVCAVYVPGYVMPATERLLSKLSLLWSEDSRHESDATLSATAAELVGAAIAVNNAWHKLCRRPMEPLCLNIQLPYACNQDCVYCYTRSISRQLSSNEALNQNAITMAAKLVATYCSTHQVPLQIDIQGLGEPTARWLDLLWCVNATQKAAADAGIAWSGHLSTNGQISVEQAVWIGRTFHHVTVSCDGPPEIQDRLRPRRDGLLSSAFLIDSVAALASGNARIEARVTITDANCKKLSEVVRYIATDLRINRIRLETVFEALPEDRTLYSPQDIATACIRAYDTGKCLGADVSIASPCLTELHGEYCQTIRQTLRLMPDGVAVNCLHGVCSDRRLAVPVGHYDSTIDAFILDRSWQDIPTSILENIPESCLFCINVYHCTRSCPDSCPIVNPDDSSWRCLFQKSLAEAWILRSVDKASSVWEGSQSCSSLPQLMADIEQEARQVLAPSDCRTIVADTLKAATHYSLDWSTMPMPLWTDDKACLQCVDSSDILLHESQHRTGAISVYLHLPFCSKRCIFCDCHSVVLRGEATGQLTAYMACLNQDIEHWCIYGGMGHRPVTTIHFGGGTPNILNAVLLEDTVAAIRSQMAVNVHTQWAIETTSEDSTPRHVEHLLALGFRRLHIGVQTLQNDLRYRLGRSSSSEVVLTRLQLAMKMGMVTSVDMLYGLPGQTIVDLISNLKELIETGIHGVSLYRLNISSQKQRFFREFPSFEPHSLRDCVMLQAAEQILLGAGYRKNHHVHYARPEDDNCYYQHAIRGEDLLGIGASASGAIGRWEYRYAFYKDYVSRVDKQLPIAVIAHNPLPSPWNILASSLVAGAVKNSTILEHNVALLFERWIHAGLLVEDTNYLRVTATGAWLLATMLRELHVLSQQQ